MGQLLKLWTVIFTSRLFSKKTKSKLQLLCHQGLQRNFCQNWFSGVSKCPLFTGNSKLVEFQSQKQKPWLSKLQFCYCLFSGVWTLSNLSVFCLLWRVYSMRSCKQLLTAHQNSSTLKRRYCTDGTEWRWKSRENFSKIQRVKIRSVNYFLPYNWFSMFEKYLNLVSFLKVIV